jgi:hypothetical protein
MITVSNGAFRAVWGQNWVQAHFERAGRPPLPLFGTERRFVFESRRVRQTFFNVYPPFEF